MKTTQGRANSLLIAISEMVVGIGGVSEGLEKEGTIPKLVLDDLLELIVAPQRFLQLWSRNRERLEQWRRRPWPPIAQQFAGVRITPLTAHLKAEPLQRKGRAASPIQTRREVCISQLVLFKRHR